MFMCVVCCLCIAKLYDRHCRRSIGPNEIWLWPDIIAGEVQAAAERMDDFSQGSLSRVTLLLGRIPQVG
jgi:hypothetical protein